MMSLLEKSGLSYAGTTGTIRSGTFLSLRNGRLMGDTQAGSIPALSAISCADVRAPGMVLRTDTAYSAGSVCCSIIEQKITIE